MKKRTIAMLLTGTMILLLCGCGNKPVVVSDNEVSGNIVVGSDSSTFVPYSESSSNTMISSESVSSAEATPGVSSDSVSSDGVSMDGVSADGASNNAVEPTQNPSLGTQTPNASVSDNVSIDDLTGLSDGGNCLYIANMTGKDISTLSISFSAGLLVNTEILDGETLKDGSLFTYTIVDMASLESEDQLTLTINATDRSKASMSFAAVDIIDPSHMLVVLTSSEDGFTMYLR